MDYETPDGSQFSLQPIWLDDREPPTLLYTSVSAFVDGKAYVGKLEKQPDEIEDEQLLGCLIPVPAECLQPLFPPGFTIAPPFDARKHYLKGPSFQYELGRPGCTIVAQSVLNEVTVLEKLLQHPHPNLARYYGCVVDEGRIKQICLARYAGNLTSWLEQNHNSPSPAVAHKIMDGVEAGVRHLHALGMAHNDINPENICIDKEDRAVIVDFDCCYPFGERMCKGSSVRVYEGDKGDEAILSDPENDFEGMEYIASLLLS